MPYAIAFQARAIRYWVRLGWPGRRGLALHDASDGAEGELSLPFEEGPGVLCLGINAVYGDIGQYCFCRGVHLASTSATWPSQVR